MRKLYLDQYGHRYFASSLKELKAQVPGRVQKMYADKKDGTTVHVGYVIGDHWLNAFIPLEIPA